MSSTSSNSSKAPGPRDVVSAWAKTANTTKTSTVLGHPRTRSSSPADDVPTNQPARPSKIVTKTTQQPETNVPKSATTRTLADYFAPFSNGQKNTGPAVTKDTTTPVVAPAPRPAQAAALPAVHLARTDSDAGAPPASALAGDGIFSAATTALEHISPCSSDSDEAQPPTAAAACPAPSAPVQAARPRKSTVSPPTSSGSDADDSDDEEEDACAPRAQAPTAPAKAAPATKASTLSKSTQLGPCCKIKSQNKVCHPGRNMPSLEALADHVNTKHWADATSVETLAKMDLLKCSKCKCALTKTNAPKHEMTCNGEYTRGAAPKPAAVPAAATVAPAPAVATVEAEDATDADEEDAAAADPAPAPAPAVQLSTATPLELVAMFSCMDGLSWELALFPHHNHTPANMTNVQTAMQIQMGELCAAYSRVCAFVTTPEFTSEMREALIGNVLKAIFATGTVLLRDTTPPSAFQCCKQMSQDMAAWLARVCAEIKEMAEDGVRKFAVDDHPDEPQVMDAEERANNQVNRLMGMGNAFKAAQLILSKTGPCSLTDEIKALAAAKLNAMGDHALPLDGDNGMPELRVMVDKLEVQDLWKAASALTRGAALGSGVFSPEFIKMLLNNSHLQSAEKFLHFVKLIVLGQVPADARPYLTGGALICLPKAGGDVRAVAPQGSLFKLIEKVLYNGVVKAAPAVLKNQYGIGCPNGVPAATKSCVAALLADPDHVLLQLDAANAFSSLHRPAVYKALSTSAPFKALAPWFKMAYGQPLRITARSPAGITTIEAASGVIQGTVLAPLFFAVAMQAALDVAIACPSTLTVAYIDDVSLVGPAAAVEFAANVFADELAKVGLSLNAGKCVLTRSTTVYSRPAPDQLAPAQLAHDAIKIKLGTNDIEAVADGTVLLGTPLGTDAFVEAHFQAILDDEVTKIKTIEERVTLLQTRFHMLTMTRTAPMQHLARSCAPHNLRALEAVMAKHDTAMLEACHRMVAGTSPSQPAPAWPTTLSKPRMQLPIAKGGLGVGNSAAHISAMAIGSHHAWLTHANTDRLKELPDPNAGLWNERLLATNIKYQPFNKPPHADQDTKPLPRTLAELAELPLARPQAWISNIINKKLADDHINAIKLLSNDAIKLPILAHINSLGQQGATMALRALPSSPRTTIPNSEYPVFLQIQLDYYSINTIPPLEDNYKCSCTHSMLTLQHAIGCNPVKEGMRTTRHNEVAFLLGDACRGAHCRVAFEPRYAGDGKEGADLATHLNNELIVLDATVVTPYRTKWLKRSATTAGDLLAYAEKGKDKKYVQMYKNAASVFLPVAYEITGAMGHKAKSFWARLRAHVRDNVPACLFPCTYATPTYVQYHQMVIAVHLARTAVQTLERNVKRVRAANLPHGGN